MYSHKNIRLRKLRAHFGWTWLQKRRDGRGEPLFRFSRARAPIYPSSQFCKWGKSSTESVFKSRVEPRILVREPWILSLGVSKSQSFEHPPWLNVVELSTISCRLLCSVWCPGRKVCKETLKPCILGRRWSAVPGRREKGQSPTLFFTLAPVED